MMSKTIIKVDNISKRYRLGIREKQVDTLTGQLTNLIKSPWENLKRLRDMSRFVVDDESVFWALKDVNFEVKEGEVLGIIGKNGAGKSTLLKLLSQITEPTSGKIEIHGRVASLLEVGTGFHPELSGRENVYMNGTILGMTRREIDSKLDEIVDFSGIEKFLDTAVKFYSSGMKVRLGFSVAAHLEPEILIIDEVLAVGDYEFQQKCLGKMEDVSKNLGRTVLFVSHDLGAIKNLCTSGLILENGLSETYNSIDYAIKKYIDKTQKADKPDQSKYYKMIGDKSVEILDVEFLDYFSNETLHVISSGSPIKIRFQYKCKDFEDVSNLHISIAFSTMTGAESFSCSNSYIGKKIELLQNFGVIELYISKWPLNVGAYTYRIHVENNGFVSCRIVDAGIVNVSSGDFFGSGFKVPKHLNGVLIDHEWSLIS